jgi:hypothetical protein
LVLIKPKKKNLRLLASKRGILKNVVSVKDEPLVKSTKILMPSPKFNYTKDGSLGLTHCELISSITTSSTHDNNNGFNVLGWPINAGLKATFPFLSSLAQNYKSYEFLSLTFSFVARGNYTRDGAIMFYAEYDPDTAPPENRIEFLNRSNAVEAQVFKNTDYSLKPKDMRKEKSHYVRLGKVDEKSDLKLYDTANLFFAYEGTPKETLIGDIFVSYNCVLSTPTLRLAEKQIKSIESCKGTGNASGQSMTNPFGGSAGLTAGNFVGDFLSGLLNAATGSFAGQFFSTAKSVCKFVQCLFTKNSGAFTPNDVALSVGIPKTNNEYLSYLTDGNLMIINEDDEDILYKAANAADQTTYDNLFTDITSTNSVLIQNAVNGSSERVMSWAVIMPANAVMRLVSLAGGSNLAPGPFSTITFSDLDARKTGEINGLNVQFFND